ncbi:Ig-like domain-containing protein [Patescibacteria group bacterium]
MLLCLIVIAFAGCSEQADTFIGSNVGPEVTPDLETVIFKAEPLRIKSVYPRVGASDIETNTSINFAFTEPIDTGTFSEDDIKLRYINPDMTAGQMQIAFNWQLHDDNQSVTIIPEADYLPAESVELVITCDIHSLEKMKLEKENEAFINDVCFTADFVVQ